MHEDSALSVLSPEMDDFDVVENEDGSASFVEMVQPEAMEQDFYVNLATVYDPVMLRNFGADLLDLIEKDKQARTKRDKQYKDALERTGAAGPAPGGADFEGASKVTHPAMLSVGIDFASRVVKELLPSEGAVKASIAEGAPPQENERGARIAAHMNRQLYYDIKEFRAEFEQCITQLPYGGSQYMKVWWDGSARRPRVEFVAIDDLYIPFSASTFITSQRTTHCQYLNRHEMGERISSRMYKPVEIDISSDRPELTQTARVNLKIEGYDESGYNEDGLRVVYETQLYHDFGEDEGVKPYIVAIDEYSKDVVAIYRNWSPDDPTSSKLEWIVDFPFIPWRGPYGIGFPQILGGLPAAITGALRALLDSAHAQNAPSAYILKQAAVTGQTKAPVPGEARQIESRIPLDDIRKGIMPVTYNGPSNVLLELLGVLNTELKGILSMSLDNLADSNTNVPVGTQYSRVEQGLIVFSAIHKRLHASFSRLLSIIYRLNAQYLDDSDIMREYGMPLVTPQDYQGPPVIIPVSDPNIFSEAQRMTQIQGAMGLAAQFPQVYDVRALNMRMLKLMKVDNPEELVPPPPQPPPPQDVNPVIENAQMMVGGPPPIAIEQQDHESHLVVHIDLLRNKYLGQTNPVIASTLIPAMLGHIKQHLAYWYIQMAQGAIAMASPVGQDINGILKNPAFSKESAELAAAASPLVMDTANKLFGGMSGERYGADLPQIIQEAFALLKELQEQMPKDPVTEVEHRALDIQQEKEKTDAQIKVLKVEKDQERTAGQMDMQEENADIKREEIRAGILKNEQDNETALQVASMRKAEGDLRDGKSLDK